jgi:hypothetical protein
MTVSDTSATETRLSWLVSAAGTGSSMNSCSITNPMSLVVMCPSPLTSPGRTGCARAGVPAITSKANATPARPAALTTTPIPDRAIS